MILFESNLPGYASANFFPYTVRSMPDSRKYAVRQSEVCHVINFARWSEVSLTVRVIVSLTLPNLINSTYELIIHHTYIESSYKTEKIRNKTNKSILTVWHTSDRVRKKISHCLRASFPFVKKKNIQRSNFKLFRVVVANFLSVTGQSIRKSQSIPT